MRRLRSRRPRRCSSVSLVETSCNRVSFRGRIVEPRRSDRIRRMDLEKARVSSHSDIGRLLVVYMLTEPELRDEDALWPDIIER